ncbi:DUF4259 domain-containing protein [Corynebacterium sp. H130]|uniref:DUF4259 domain-containing protein n=1 Tax=Corynebacterium sp. H130 TaxID=3133444 RepID=UPI0030B61409
MGAWGAKPWENDHAADWFHAVFEGIDIDAHIDHAFECYDNYEEIRAACYLLEVLGVPYIWPGKLDRLQEHIDTGIDLLTQMIAPDSDFLELWDNDPRLIDEIKEQIEALHA